MFFDRARIDCAGGVCILFDSMCNIAIAFRNSVEFRRPSRHLMNPCFN